MKEKDAYVKAIAKRDKEVRRLVFDVKKSKSEVARMFRISRERVRQIVFKGANQ